MMNKNDTRIATKMKKERAEFNKLVNFNQPELEKLDEVAGQYDFLVQEGVFYTKEEKERALFLLNSIEELVNQLVVKGE